MKKLIAPVILASLLAACASTPKPAPVAPTPAPASKPAMVDLTKQTTDESEDKALTDPNSILSHRRVFFDFDSYVIKPEYNDLIQAHAQYLIKHPKTKLTIQGNADDRGTAEYNVALGQKRADAVKAVMHAMGAPDNQIETVSFGKEKPLVQGNNEAAWSQNRRDEIVYQGEKQQ